MLTFIAVCRVTQLCLQSLVSLANVTVKYEYPAKIRLYKRGFSAANWECKHIKRREISSNLIKMLLNPTGTSQTNLSVCIQRVKHRGRRQEVPVSQIFSAALLKPQLLRFREYPVTVFSSHVGDIVTLPPQCGAQRPDGRSDPEGRRLLDILHHYHNTHTHRWAHYQLTAHPHPPHILC